MRLTSHKASRATRIELSMTSMIDVVFLLLVFFMVTASFVKTERELNPAILQQSASARAKQDLEPTIVHVKESGGQFVYQIGENEFTEMGALTNLLRKLYSGASAQVYVHDEVPYDMAATAIQACKTAGYEKVSYVPFAGN